MGHQRIGHQGPLTVFYSQRHGVIDVNLFRKNAAVSVISVLRFAVIIHRLHPGYLTVQIHILALSCMRTGAASLTPLFPCGAIEPQRSVGKDFLRLLADQPVHNIKMMGGFMYQQSSAVLQLSVPSAEIIGSVNRVQHPLKMYVQNLSHHSLGQQFLHPGKQRHVAAVKCHSDPPSIALFRIQNGIAAVCVHGHGFLTDHVHPQVQRLHHILTVKTVHCSDDGTVRSDLLHHFIKVRIHRHLIRNQAFHILCPLPVHIHDSGQVRHIVISLRYGRGIHPVSSSTGTH